MTDETDLPNKGWLIGGVAAVLVWLAGLSIFEFSAAVLFDCGWIYCGPPVAGVGAFFILVGLPAIAIGVPTYLAVAFWGFGLRAWRGPLVMVLTIAFQGGIIAWGPEVVSRSVGWGLFLLAGILHFSGGIIVFWDTMEPRLVE